MAIRTGNNLLKEAAQGLADSLSAGKVKLYTGTRPTNLTDTATGTLIATHTFGATAESSITNGKITFNLPNATSLGNYTIGYARIEKSDGTVLWDAVAGTTASPQDINFDTLSVVTDQIIQANTFTYEFT